MKNAVILLGLIASIGGLVALFQILGIWAQIFIGIFPLFARFI